MDFPAGIRVDSGWNPYGFRSDAAAAAQAGGGQWGGRGGPTGGERERGAGSGAGGEGPREAGGEREWGGEGTQEGVCWVGKAGWQMWLRLQNHAHLAKYSRALAYMT